MRDHWLLILVAAAGVVNGINAHLAHRRLNKLEQEQKPDGPQW